MKAFNLGKKVLFFYLFQIISACTSIEKKGEQESSTIKIQDESFYRDSLVNAAYVQALPDSEIARLLDQIDARLEFYEKDSLLLSLADALKTRAPHFESDPMGSIRYNKTILRLRRNFHGEDTDLDIAKTLLTLALAHQKKGEYQDALERLQQAELASRDYPVHPMLLIMAKQGEIYSQVNDFENAEIKFKFLFEKIDSFEKISESLDPKFWGLAEAWFPSFAVAKSTLENKMKEFYKALQTVAKGINLVKKFPPVQKEFETQYLRISEGVAWLDSSKNSLPYHNCASCIKNAITNFYEALKYFSKIQMNSLVVQSCINLGSAYELSGQYQKAIEVLQTGIDSFMKNEGSLPSDLFTQLHLNLGTNLYRMNKMEDALIAYDKALYGPQYKDKFKTGLPPLSHYSRDYQTSLVLLGSIGRVRLKQSYTDPDMMVLANAAYDTLFSLINYMRSNLTDDRAKLILAERSQEWLPDAFADIKELYLRTGNPYYLEQAFQISEQGKAFALLEASRLKNATDLLPEQLIRAQEELMKAEILAAKSDSLKEQTQKLKLEFQSRLKKEAPAYFALKYRGPELRTTEIQTQLIDSNQAILSYFMEDSVLNIFLISRKEIALDTLHISRSELSEWVDSFRTNLNPIQADGSLDTRRVESFLLSAHQLYRHLIGSVAGRHSLPERLIIIPDGPLADLSFDALLIRQSGDKPDLPAQVRERNFLVQHHVISYCFSAGLLQEMNRKSTKTSLSPQLALFAPRFDPGSTLLPYLKNQEKEVEAIRGLVPDASVSDQGTKESFLVASQKNAYLHLCAHGFVSSDPDSSFIAFYQKTAQADSSQFFYLSELYRHRLDQDLITLTACETALGQHRSGEGNISLARGFAYAGVKSFITTLWKIQTEGAARIIPSFYDHFLNQKLPKDVALALSKRAYLEEGKGVYPENWAGMILIGSSTAPSLLQESTKYELWIGSLALLLLVAWGVMMLKKRN